MFLLCYLHIYIFSRFNLQPHNSVLPFAKYLYSSTSALFIPVEHSLYVAITYWKWCYWKEFNMPLPTILPFTHACYYQRSYHTHTCYHSHSLSHDGNLEIFCLKKLIWFNPIQSWRLRVEHNTPHTKWRNIHKYCHKEIVRIYTHTHIHSYLWMYRCVCVCVTDDISMKTCKKNTFGEK